MEFTLQSYEILIIGLMVMGLFLAVIPVRPMDARLKGYRISLIFMALSFAALATAVGYSERSNFSRQFKSITGFTPGEYRKRLQID